MDEEIKTLVLEQGVDYNWWVDFVYRHQIDADNPEHSKYCKIIQNGFQIIPKYVPAVFAFVRRHGVYVARATYLTPFVISELPNDSRRDDIHRYVIDRLKEILPQKRDYYTIAPSEIDNAIEWNKRVDCARHQSDVINHRNGGLPLVL